MRILKEGGHCLFEKDQQTAAVVSEMLLELERNGMDAVRNYSRKLDDWNPASFELTPVQVAEAIAQLPPQAIADTDFCQGNVRRFAERSSRRCCRWKWNFAPVSGWGTSTFPRAPWAATFPEAATRCSVRRR